MLYEQIPARLRDRIATELKFDLKLFSATFSESPTASTRISKLQLVVNYIEKNEPVGTVDEPAKFFSEIMNLRWGPFGRDSEQMVYFGGVTNNQTVLGLGGSIKHVIGAVGTSVIDRPSSLAPSIISILNSALDETRTSPIHKTHLDRIAFITRRLEGPIQNCEFLAKRLLEGNDKREKKVLLGSPIYVALAD